MQKISACVTAFNEEKKIARCLQSLLWCDEIIVVDSFSTDRTVEICRQFTDRVYQRPWLGYIGQRNMIREMAANEWVLFLDADEELSPQLKEEIKREINSDAPFVGYAFPRMVYYLGKWIKHGEWWPDVKLRLFMRDRGRSVGREPHDQVKVDGPVKTMKSPIYHYTYDSINDHLRTMNRFSTITALEKYKEGIRFQWSDILLRPFWRFFKAYILKKGFMSGRHGLLIATVSAFAVAMKYYKLWEMEYYSRHPEKQIFKPTNEDIPE